MSFVLSSATVKDAVTITVPTVCINLASSREIVNSFIICNFKHLLLATGAIMNFGIGYTRLVTC